MKAFLSERASGFENTAAPILQTFSRHIRTHTPLIKRPASLRAFRYRGNACRYDLRSSGTLPPLAASLAITCLCSQMFMVAESLVSPV